MNRGNVAIPLVLLAAYAVFAVWMIGRLHTPVSVTFAELTEYTGEEARPERLASHPYLKWTGKKADRSRRNVILHDRRAAWPGYNLFTDDKQHVLLKDMDGKVVHAWRVPDYHWSEYAVGETTLDLPHMPRMLPTGNILVFDNGEGRGYSRIVEVDPAREKIVWEYEADPPASFFSPWRGSSQRLPNGNTLICSSERGRVFEATPDGKIVWEFWNPIFNEQGQRRRIYRFARLAADEVEAFLTMARDGSGFTSEPIDWEMIVLLALPLALLGLAVPLWRRRRAAAKAAA